MQHETQTLEAIAQHVETREDFVRFLESLVESLHYEPENWENGDVESFLTGLRGFTGDMTGYYERARPEEHPDQPSWRVFADMLLAARVYE